MEVFDHTYLVIVLFLLSVDVALVYKLSRMSGFGKLQKRMMIMLVACVFCAGSDMLCVVMEQRAGHIGTFFLNCAFDFSFGFVGFYLFYYSEKKYRSGLFKNRKFRILASAPLMLLGILLLVSFWTGWIFRVSAQGDYSRGPLYYVFYAIIAGGYMGWTTLVNIHRMIIQKDERKKKMAEQSFAYAIPVIAGTLIQMRFPEYPCSNMGLTTTILLMFIDAQEELLRIRMEEEEKDRSILVSLCREFSNVYHVDLRKDTLEIIKQEETTNAAISEKLMQEGKLQYSCRIKDYYDHCIVQKAAPDFMEKMNAEHLMKVLEHQDRFVYRYRAKKNLVGREYFEAQAILIQEGDDEFQVVIGFRPIDDIVREEREHQELLERALRDVTMSNEIISAISKIYFLIYQIDIENDFIEQISNREEIHRLTGQSGSASMMGRQIYTEMVAPEYREQVKGFFDLATLPDRLAHAETIMMEYMGLSGSWYSGRFIVKNRNEEGRVTHVLYVVSAIDAQKRQEMEYQRQLHDSMMEAERANRAKTNFLRRMSHDIRTPINGVMGMATIAKRSLDDPDKQRQCLNKIISVSHFLLDLVNEVLDMNKLESGEIELENRPFDLQETLEEATTVVEEQAREAGLHFCEEYQELSHNKVIGSPLHLKRIVQNIMGNAVKYNREHGSIRVSCREVGSDEKTATFEWICRDSGIGMSEEFQKRVFDPFAQEGDSARTTYAGTGLGLAIVKELIERMGGSIRFESKKGAGTTFFLRFVFEKDREVKASGETEVLPEVSLEGTRILLVEDNELNMEIAEYLLAEEGAVVDQAWNGKDAVEKFADSAPGTYEIILMDIMMPVMNGLEAAKQIRAMDRPDAATVPIIAMTANAFLEDIRRSREAGMNEHISKPLDISKFLLAVRKMKQMNRQQRQMSGTGDRDQG
ncbi:ATP-binding protein [Brotaphodocola sp.]|uniref:ATP-binding protein n=1 Tax=Brotaphodocola sp. TaxID=3073577 RepID=UPI003D7E9C43